MAQSVSPQELLRQLQIIGAVVGNRRLPTTVPTAAALQTQTSQPNTVPVFAYKVKIINPTKKSEVVVRQVNFTTKFDSITAMRVRFVEQFQEQVPNTMDFKLGYYGAQQAKVSLITSEDLNAMYLQHPTGGLITLWCEGRTKEEEKRK